ncbi:POU domain, class 4, transcription factor 1-like [Ctenocephalides felis]|uniref:POU domain, class 4, transcription factor 1-like n=1 Tax=Ctenocephalides felis TaxID=7515 RepID=UPI000E6E1B4A|nr:POU domain, class 4, transcription factor 1-like [Ctenocephalides felis]
MGAFNATSGSVVNGGGGGNGGQLHGHHGGYHHHHAGVVAGHAAGVVGAHHHMMAHHHHHHQHQQSMHHAHHPAMAAAAAAAAAAGLHPDADTDPRELEAFAERFKQRRIKLGVTQVQPRPSAPEAEAHEVRGAALTECRTDAGVRGPPGSGGDAAAAAAPAGGGGQWHCARFCWGGLWVLRIMEIEKREKLLKM